MSDLQSLPPRLRRAEVPPYLHQKHGVTVSTATLARWASQGGGGPKFQKDGNWPLYSTDELDRWAAARLSPLVGSTSELGATNTARGRPPRSGQNGRRHCVRSGEASRIESGVQSRDLRIIPTRQVADMLACQPRQVSAYCRAHGVPFTRLSPKNCGMTPDNLALLLQRTTRLETDAVGDAGDVSELVQ